MQSPFKVEFVSWHRIVHLCYLLASKVEADHYQPDLVIAIARGGYVPARLICDYLDIYNLTSLRISHYLGGTDKSEAAKLSIPLNIDITDMKVLLVDDVDDSGDTLQLALEHIKGLKPAAVKVAVLHHKLISTIEPDYYAQKIIKWRWLTYPWAVVEDVQGFIRKMDPKPTSVTEAMEYFAKTYRTKLPLQVMEQVFRKMT